MSLKYFHIFFISVSTLLAIGFGLWEMDFYFASGSSLHLLFAILSFLFAASLILYGIKVYQKLKKL